MRKPRLAILATHPIQYQAPWFRYLAAAAPFDFKVFYLWDFGIEARYDQGFQRTIQWDVPLLDGYPSEIVPNTSSAPGTHHLRGLRNPTLPERLRAFQPDAALTLGYRYETLLRLIFSRRGFPLIMRGDSHRLIARPAGWRSSIKRLGLSLIYRRFAAHLYVGKANHAYYRGHGVPEARLFFSPHAVDEHLFDPRSESIRQAAAQWRLRLGIPSHHLLVLFAGKYEEKKRPLDLLEAFQRLHRDDVTLLFCGAGSLEGDLRRLAAEHPAVRFAPFQNQSEMPHTYAAADLFVLPSYGPEETWGLAVNEAMLMEKPVIVSDHVGAASDLVVAEKNGLTFPAGNIPALSAALARALRDREELREWGRAGRPIAQEYNYERATEGLVAALSSTRPHSP